MNRFLKVSCTPCKLWGHVKIAIFELKRKDIALVLDKWMRCHDTILNLSSLSSLIVIWSWNCYGRWVMKVISLHLSPIREISPSGQGFPTDSTEAHLVLPELREAKQQKPLQQTQQMRRISWIARSSEFIVVSSTVSLVIDCPLGLVVISHS